jgi:hypothetical protein
MNACSGPSAISRRRVTIMLPRCHVIMTVNEPFSYRSAREPGKPVQAL